MIKMNKEKIGIVAACMNREKMLAVSLQSWLSFNEISEIVIVDWSSKNSLEKLETIDERIKVIRVNGEQHFNIGKAYNLAFQNSTVDKVLKMDVDYILNPYYNLFQSNIELTRDIFITGHFMDKHEDNKMGFIEHLNGFVYLYRESFKKCGYTGWDNYGSDDEDLYRCLKKNNLKRVRLYDTTNTLFIYHNPHDNKIRTENYMSKGLCNNRQKLKDKYNNKKRKE